VVVHCNQPGLFAGRDPVRHLFPLLNPILWIVRDLIEVLVEAEQAEMSRDRADAALGRTSSVRDGLDLDAVVQKD